MNKNLKFNASGYRDMTAYKAIAAADREEKRKKSVKTQPQMVYICSPYAGDTEANVANALRYCRFALSKGMFPIAPHCYFPRFMDDSNPAERELAMSFAIRMLNDCFEIWVFGSKITDGMEKEILAANKHLVLTRRFDEHCREVL